jgi:hypothetical protein
MLIHYRAKLLSLTARILYRRYTLCGPAPYKGARDYPGRPLLPRRSIRVIACGLHLAPMNLTRRFARPSRRGLV